MAKPTPKLIEFNLADGFIQANCGTLSVGRETDKVEITLTEEDREEAAATLIAVAQHILNGIGDPEVSKRVLLEAGLLEANSLRDSSNDLKVLRVKGKVMLSKSEGQEEQTGLTEKTEQTLLSAGIEPDVIRYFSSLNGYVRALNSSVNPAKAALTMMGKETFNARFEGWLKKNPTPVPIQEDSAAGPCVHGLEECSDCGPITSSKAFAVEEDLDV